MKAATRETFESIPESVSSAYPRHVAHLRAEYARVLEQLGYAAVVLHSGALVARSTFDDQFWPLRVVPHFAHWVPLEWADSVLVVGRAGAPRLCAFRDASFWERAPEPSWSLFQSSLDVRELAAADDARSDIDAMRALGRVAFVAEAPARAAALGFADEDVNPAALLRELDALRVVKTDYEVACLAEANRRSALGHNAVAQLFLRGVDVSELDLHIHYLEATRQDAFDAPYKGIVALNSNAAILHHVHYGRATPSGDRSLLIDAGAGFLGYGSDVTRTYVTGTGEVASTFRELVRRLDALQRHACGRLELGLPYEKLHDDAHRDVAVALREVGIARASEEALVEGGVTRLFFPHGLGHSLGLQTHDVGCLVAPPKPENPWLRNTTPVSAGQVFTIEPGIYFIDSLLAKLAGSPAARDINWALVDALRAFGGVRVEDDLFVQPTPGGPVGRNLTREALGD